MLGFLKTNLLLQEPQLLLGVWPADQTPGLLDQNKPAPIPASQILAEVPLSNLDQLPLVKLLFVDIATDPLQHLTLDHTHPLDDQLVTLFLKGTKGASAEEDKGVSLNGEVDIQHMIILVFLPSL